MPRTRGICPAGGRRPGTSRLGDTEKVFERPEQALAVRDVHLIYVPWDVKWQALRGAKRFRDLLRRAGLGAEPAH